ncbi:hypothetical protein QBC44DRAFT_95479 [Cladorrhinum sp. PSN332]|nr:hypothetical protein QBC44DRAFT_95479 [Cladorrhinum sp. PSN332]
MPLRSGPPASIPNGHKQGLSYPTVRQRIYHLISSTSFHTNVSLHILTVPRVSSSPGALPRTALPSKSCHLGYLPYYLGKSLLPSCPYVIPGTASTKAVLSRLGFPSDSEFAEVPPSFHVVLWKVRGPGLGGTDYFSPPFPRHSISFSSSFSFLTRASINNTCSTSVQHLFNIRSTSVQSLLLSCLYLATIISRLQRFHCPFNTTLHSINSFDTHSAFGTPSTVLLDVQQNSPHLQLS